MAFKAEALKKKANYYSIKEATFRLPSSKDDGEAVRREYTNPKTKEEGVAYERAFKALYGVITGISFPESTLKDGTVLRNLHISLGEDEEGIEQVISVPVDSRYATDFLKRLPSIDLSKEVRFMPYDFEKDGPRQVGISIAHKNAETDEYTEKVDSNFFTKVEEKNGEKVYTNLHGFPEATEEDASDWPFYFKRVSKFLIAYTKAQILPKFTEEGKDDLAFAETKDEPKEPRAKDYAPKVARTPSKDSNYPENTEEEPPF